jgi:hypothetical protein
MGQSKPDFRPTSAKAGAAKQASAHMPTQEPPRKDSRSGLRAASKSISNPSVSATASDIHEGSMPTLRPMMNRQVANAAWHDNATVAGLWSINEDRNSWLYLNGDGWKKLSVASPSGVVALTMLASHAYEKGAISAVYEGDDAQVSQLYVW